MPRSGTDLKRQRYRPSFDMRPRDQMQHLLFLFLDGVGLGADAPSNPFAEYDGNAFKELAAGHQWVSPFPTLSNPFHTVRPLDATLGIEGLPQSGTGQATLFTGVNCAKLVGRHFGPFPHSKTHDTLRRQNLFQQIRDQRTGKGALSAFANAFPPQYFNATRRRATVTTFCCNASHVPLRDIQALRSRRAVPADLTGTTWRSTLDLDVPLQTPEEAAENLAGITRRYALTLFEYFYTDKVGHHRIDTSPTALLNELNRFLHTLLDQLDPDQDTLLITSDHGNFEDPTHTQHTRNPVPLIVHGWAAPFFRNADRLTDVTPGILDALTSSSSTEN